jgi:hypothetical protein
MQTVKRVPMKKRSATKDSSTVILCIGSILVCLSGKSVSRHDACLDGFTTHQIYMTTDRRPVADDVVVNVQF